MNGIECKFAGEHTWRRVPATSGRKSIGHFQIGDIIESASPFGKPETVVVLRNDKAIGIVDVIDKSTGEQRRHQYNPLYLYRLVGRFVRDDEGGA